jgi:5'-nucleotidase
MEGTLLGVPSIAVSLMDPDAGFTEAGRIARLVAMRVLVEGLPPRTLLNVNVPAGTPRGIRLTQLGHRVYKEKIVEQTDPRGRTFYWIGAGPPEWDRRDQTDMAAIHDGYASMTPLHLDLTHVGALARMADWPRALTAQYNGRPRGRKR